MQRQTWFYSALLIFGLYLNCGTSRDSSTNKTQQLSGNEEPALESPRISPNHCRIVGTIVEINSSLAPANTDNPCSKVPCKAWVSIDEIIGYGSGFSNPLAKGAKVRVFFRFTLAPTKELFPNMKKHYPGLSVGSSFIADLEEQRSPDQSEKPNQRSFLVYGYTIQ